MRFLLMYNLNSEFNALNPTDSVALSRPTHRILNSLWNCSPVQNQQQCLNSATKFDATMFSPKGKTLLRRYFVAELYIRSTFVTRRLQVDFHYCDTMRTLLQQTSLTPNFCCNNFFHCCNKIFFLKIEFSRLLQQCHCCDKIRFLIFNIGNSKK